MNAVSDAPRLREKWLRSLFDTGHYVEFYGDSQDFMKFSLTELKPFNATGFLIIFSFFSPLHYISDANLWELLLG